MGHAWKGNGGGLFEHTTLHTMTLNCETVVTIRCVWMWFKLYLHLANSTECGARPWVYAIKDASAVKEILLKF